MSDKIIELNEIKKKLVAGGGEKLISEQHNKGKLTARERLNHFFDEGTFIETGLFINSFSTKINSSEGVVTGYGQVNGRLVYAFSDDYTILNGSLGKKHIEKILKCQEDAIKLGVPIIYMFDSSGIRIDEGIETLSTLGIVLKNISDFKGIIPQISVVFGQCAGTLSFAATLTDFSFMISKESKMFLTGLEGLKDSDKAKNDEKAYGSAMAHSSNTGIVDFVAENENECLIKIRDLLSYLPQNAREMPEEKETNDDLNRLCVGLNDINFESFYDVKNIIIEVADDNIFFEASENYAKNLITGFIHLGEITVGVIANNKNELNGEIDIASAKKAEKFIKICNSFSIPILSIVDSDGFVKTLAEENGGNIKYASDMIYAYSNASVPMVSLIINKAIGTSFMCMGNKALGIDEVFALPSAKIAVMNENMLFNILYDEKLKNASETERAEMMDELDKEIISPYLAASLGIVDDIIEPLKTRQHLISAFDKLLTKAL